MGFPYRQLAVVLSLLGGVAGAQIVEPTTAPASGNTANPTNIRYFSESGLDANDCLTPATSCLTQAKATTFLPANNVTIALKGGDHFKWSLFGQQNRINSTNSTTYATIPVLGQNVTVTSYGTGPYILEGADEIQGLPWTSIGSGTYSAIYPAGTVIAESVYVDTKDQDSAAAGPLLRAPNGPIAPWAGGTVQPGTLVSMSGSGTYVASNLGPTTTTPNVNFEAWRQSIDGSFLTTNTGVQNVQLVPGSVYNDTVNNTIYIHLADGSSPAGHVVQASNRLTAIQCESCNGWLVTQGTVEKYIYNGVVFVNYSMANLTNAYYTNLNNQISVMNFWDNTSELRWLYTGQSPASRVWRSFDAGILLNNQTTARTDLVSTGWKINSSIFGRHGNLAISPSGDGVWSAIYMDGSTNGEVGANTIKTYVANGISAQSGNNPWVHDNQMLVQNRGSVLNIANNHGFLGEWNKVIGGAGDAIQAGGFSTCTGTWDWSGHPENDVPGAFPCILRNNVIADYGQIRNALYNCIDTNTDQIVKNFLLDHNTGVNCWGAIYTFEVNNGSQAGAGITDVTFRNNIASMHKAYWPYTDGATSGMNNSPLIYFANTTVPLQNGFFHSYNNVFQLGSATTPISKVGSYATFFALVGDTTSIVVPNTSDPIFTDITNGDYRLKLGSPAVNQPAVGLNAGALGTDYTQTFGARYPGISITAGQAFKR